MKYKPYKVVNHQSTISELVASDKDIIVWGDVFCVIRYPDSAGRNYYAFTHKQTTAAITAPMRNYKEAVRVGLQVLETNGEVRFRNQLSKIRCSEQYLKLKGL